MTAIGSRGGDLPPSTPDNTDDIEELSARLSKLADRINGANGPQRKGRAPAPAHRAVEDESDSQRKPAATIDVEPDGRLWPLLPLPEPDKVRALEAKIEEQSAELARRYLQIAELDKLRQAHAGELQVANDQIDLLNQSIADLNQLTAERDSDVAAASQKLVQAETEKVSLQVLLNKARKETTELSLRLLTLEGAIEDKSADVATGNETIRWLETELAALRVQSANAATLAEDRANRRHEIERIQETARFDEEIGALAAAIAERDRQIEGLQKTCAEFTTCSGELAVKALALQSALAEANETIQSQAGQIAFLDAVVKVERDNAAATMREVVAQFQHERQQLLAAEQASAEIRMNIVQLLPKLAARQRGPAEAAPDPETPHSQVA